KIAAITAITRKMAVHLSIVLLFLVYLCYSDQRSLFFFHTSVSSVSCPPPALPIPPEVGPWSGVPPFHSLSSVFFTGEPAVCDPPKRLSFSVEGLLVPPDGPPRLSAMPPASCFSRPSRTFNGP